MPLFMTWKHIRKEFRLDRKLQPASRKCTVRTVHAGSLKASDEDSAAAPVGVQSQMTQILNPLLEAHSDCVRSSHTEGLRAPLCFDRLFFLLFRHLVFAV